MNLGGGLEPGGVDQDDLAEWVVPAAALDGANAIVHQDDGAVGGLGRYRVGGRRLRELVRPTADDAPGDAPGLAAVARDGAEQRVARVADPVVKWLAVEIVPEQHQAAVAELQDAAGCV